MKWWMQENQERDKVLDYMLAVGLPWDERTPELWHEVLHGEMEQLRPTIGAPPCGVSEGGAVLDCSCGTGSPGQQGRHRRSAESQAAAAKEMAAGQACRDFLGVVVVAHRSVLFVGCTPRTGCIAFNRVPNGRASEGSLYRVLSRRDAAGRVTLVPAQPAGTRLNDLTTVS